MFDLSITKLLVLAVIALVVFGPKELPKIAAQRGITWSGHGFVYTVLADAPPQLVDAVVAALPQNTPPGFWSRLGRGLGRLASMVDPFR